MVQFFVHSYYLVNVLLVLRWVYDQKSAPAPAASPTKLKKETVTKENCYFRCAPSAVFLSCHSQEKVLAF